MTALKPTIINGAWTMAPAPEQDRAWLDRHPQVIATPSELELRRWIKTGALTHTNDGGKVA
jgi:hypothetical protein